MKKYMWFILLILWMWVIFWFSSQNATISGEYSMSLTGKIINYIGINLSSESVDFLETVIRKLAHFSEYFILGILSYMFVKSLNIIDKSAFIALMICALYAIFDEIHQYYVPGRACRILDMFIDSIGSFVSILVINILKRIYDKNN